MSVHVADHALPEALAAVVSCDQQCGNQQHGKAHCDAHHRFVHDGSLYALNFILAGRRHRFKTGTNELEFVGWMLTAKRDSRAS
jgi:hypothetical protein